MNNDEWKDKIDSEMNQDMKRKIVALKKNLKRVGTCKKCNEIIEIRNKCVKNNHRGKVLI